MSQTHLRKRDPLRQDPLPSALRKRARWTRLGAAGVPALLVRPVGPDDAPAPAVIWMHGRTVTKETDPGRYLRLMRAGVGVCAVDLPGHGERHEQALQSPRRTLEVVTRMAGEIDGIVEALDGQGDFDGTRLALGGMSAGGMAALARLCRTHPFRCAAVEATSGSWRHQRHREMFRGRSEAEVDRLDPMSHLDGWREIPLLALHARRDEWVDHEGQAAFIDALRRRYRRPELIDFVTYDRTGAPFEHAGFGRLSNDAKNRQRDFLRAHLAAE